MPSDKIAVFIDYDNIKINMKTNPPEKLSEELGYQRMKSWLSEYGEISVVFVFAPAVTIAANIEFFYQLGFVAVACPVFKTTKIESPLLVGEAEFLDYEPEETIPINKTDDIMIDLAQKTINLMPDISHICIASGDHHFIPIAELAKQMGKKVMIVFSNLKPSQKLLTFVDKNDKDKSMLHLFDPIRE